MRTAIVDAAVTSELRRAVLRPAWPPGSAMHGDDDPDALHFALYDDGGELLAACVLLPRSYPHDTGVQPSWQLRGMATSEARRGEGIGGRLLEDVLAELTSRGVAVVWCEARTAAVRFYERHGFACAGDVFTNAETGIAHVVMWRRLDGH